MLKVTGQLRIADCDWLNLHSHQFKSRYGKCEHEFVPLLYDYIYEPLLKKVNVCLNQAIISEFTIYLIWLKRHYIIYLQYIWHFRYIKAHYVIQLEMKYHKNSYTSIDSHYSSTKGVISRLIK